MFGYCHFVQLGRQDRRVQAAANTLHLIIVYILKEAEGFQYQTAGLLLTQLGKVMSCHEQKSHEKKLIGLLYIYHKHLHTKKIGSFEDIVKIAIYIYMTNSTVF